MIKAVQGHEPLIREITERGGSFKGAVHSVFHHVVNISCPGGAMVSLISKTEEQFPWSLILATENMAAHLFLPGEHICYNTENNKLCTGTGRVEIDLTNISPYELPAIAYRKSHGVQQRMAEAKAVLVADSADRASIFERETKRQMQLILAALKAAAREGNAETLQAHLYKMIGLGSGLTPAGDDYLTSLMAVACMEHSPLESYKIFIPPLIEAAEDRTNVLSHTYLKRAANGQVRGKLSRFISDLTAGGDIGASLDALLTVGSTSGRDLAMGVLFALELAFIEEERYIPDNK